MWLALKEKILIIIYIIIVIKNTHIFEMIKNE